MAYRLTSRAKQYRQRPPRQATPVAEQRPAFDLPDRRRVVIVIDYDTGQPAMHVIELFRTRRIDCYRAVADGRPWKARIGWSRVLDGLRRAMPRVHADG